METVDRLLWPALPWLLLLFVAGVVVSLLITLRHYVALRRASFFILRRRAKRKIRGGFLATVVFIALTAVVVFLLRSGGPSAEEREGRAALATLSPTPVTAVNSASMPRGTRTVLGETPVEAAGSATAPFIPSYTPTPTPSLTPVPTDTPTPSPTLTPSQTPTPSLTPSITPTPSPTVPILEAIYTPVTPSATVPADAEIGELTISRGMELNGTPVDPGTEFLVGQVTLFASFDYGNLANGILWRHVWLRDGALVGGETRIWEWGSRGRSYFFLSPEGGFQRGDYELRLLLDRRVVQTARFTVR
jgi:hypothetical protein